MNPRGWCPGLYQPMQTGDGLLVRVKPFAGRVSAAALRTLADASEAYGNGVVELTSRGNLQIRGLAEATAPLFAAAMLAAGLADPDPARERRRNVITMPPYHDALATKIERVLAETPGLAAKFCVAIGQADADIIVRHGGPAAHGPRQLTMTAAGITTPYTEAALQRLIADAAGQRLPRAAPARIPDDRSLMFLANGRTDPAGLRYLASVTDAARTTPYRAFHVPGRASPNPRPSITACPGAPACASGSTATRSDADTLAAHGIADLHLSGCVKGCAYPYPARTLVARDGRYDLVRHGLASDLPELRGLTLAQAAAALA